MKPRLVPDTATSGEDRKDGHVGQTRKSRRPSPNWGRLFRYVAGFLLDRAAVAVLVLVGIAAQVVLMVLMWQLVDITLGIAELWLELARKHLEITL